MWAGVGSFATVATAAFLVRDSCYGVASILFAAAVCSCMLRFNRTLGESFVTRVGARAKVTFFAQ